MYAKKIKYTDFNGVEREETFHFNLTEAELADMNFSVNGGLEVYINRIVETQSVTELAALFKQIIDKSYGEKSDDGKYFRKSEERLEDFKSTEAYSVLYMSLATDADAATEFINGVVPAKKEEVKSKETHPALKKK